MTTYKTPDDALGSGHGQRALGDLYTPYGKWLVVYTKRDAYIAYPGVPGLPIRKATTKEVDAAVRWRNTMHD